MQRVWRIFNKKTQEFVPAPRNATGTFATERGAKASLTQLTTYGYNRARREGFEDYEIVPCYLFRADELVWEAEE